MSANSRKTGNLVALGSAAVVAVYGAGFMRTAAAAERFAQQSTEHVLSPAEAEVIAALANDSAGITVASQTNEPTNANAPVAADATPANAATKVDATTAKSSASRAAVESNGATATTVATTPGAPDVAASRTNADARRSADSAMTATSAVGAAPPVTAPTSTAAAASPSTNTAAPVATPSSVPASAPVVAAPVVAAPVAAKPDEGATPAESKPAPKWKDGSYTGYGTSRHGDIEVYLETDGGKISYLKISQCLTQYSCSWISELPGQVIARQAPRVDAPSGATQSASAFYYAVIQALSKAK